jgi:hypothetical protein
LVINEVILAGRIAAPVERSVSLRGTVPAMTRILVTEAMAGGEYWRTWVSVVAYNALAGAFLTFAEGAFVLC